MNSAKTRLGLDLGGTKIATIVFGDGERVLHTDRMAAPRGSYELTLDAIAGAIERADLASGGHPSIGIGIPGSLAPSSGLVQNANSTWLNGRPLGRDLTVRLKREVRIANDANCFALSEAADGAGAGRTSVFGVILGTGCGGGLVSHGRLIDGPRGTGGEWGHNPLPWPDASEMDAPVCWCGKHGCMEAWVSGPAMSADYERHTGERLKGETIAARAAQGDEAAKATLERHSSRLARGLASIINVFDPEVIVLGGGLSRLEHLYAMLPAQVAPWLFSDDQRVDIRPPVHGDASGVRGAARLWDEAG
ncbi:MAG: ROK family protein [Pseudomonadota bacterium]|nr:ROK family protein [Pseudomonadota bacterium]